MTLFHRRLLVFGLLLIFAVAAPLLILYAAGYRYNTRLGRFEQLGLLYVTAGTDGNTLSVDGQSYDVNKERVIDNLRAGSYDITLTKDGYFPWSKKLEIESGKATFIRDLNLYKQTDAVPREIFVDPLTVVAKSQRWVLLSKPGFLFAFDRSNNVIAEIALSSDQTIEKVYVDDSSARAVFKQGTAWFVADFSAQTATKLELNPSLRVSAISARNGSYYLLTPDEILLWDGKTAPETLASLLFPQDVFPVGSAYWILSSDAAQKRTFLYELPSANGRAVFLQAFPYSSDIRITDVDRRFLTIYDASNKLLHLVDAQALEPATATLNGVNVFSWSKSHTELLTATDFELSIQRFDHGKTQEVLTRLSSPILDADWDADGQHALYVTGDGLFVIERDARDKRNVFELVSGRSDIRLLTESSDGNTLMFASSNKGSSYVFWGLPLH